MRQIQLENDSLTGASIRVVTKTTDWSRVTDQRDGKYAEQRL